MALAFTFPGQGSQAVGMGKALADSFATARAVFDEVDEALDQNLSQLMWDGPIEEITLTENAQPAIMAVSLAAMAALKSEFDVDVTAAKFVAGHSLGEYSALCAAGALSISDAAKLDFRRGEAEAARPVHAESRAGGPGRHGGAAGRRDGPG
jgi:[acyl-carrier-protein] S-malonyltransferase